MSLLNITEWCVLGVIFLAGLIGATCGMRPMRRVGRLFRKDSGAKEAPQAAETVVASEETEESYVIADEDDEVSDALKAAMAKIAARRAANQAPAKTYTPPANVPYVNPELLPKVSVVVYAFVNEERLTSYIEGLMQQRYPEFEVVVVCDATADAASDMADRLMSRYSNLRLTFIPPGTHQLSRRKLAWTLGIKGAEYDVILTTAAICDIPSDTWLYEMMVPLASPQVDVVLGYSRFNFKDFTGASRWYAQFDRVLANTAWISRALTSRPYRGDSYNMAFRKHLFFDNNGFASSIGKPFGDEDIFISRIATHDNTRVVVTPSTILTNEWGISARRVRITLKTHQIFAAPFLAKGPALRQGMLSLMSWIVFLLSVGLIIVNLLTSLPAVPYEAIAAFVMLLSYFGLLIAAYRKAARTLEAVKLWWAVPVFTLWRPIANMLFRIRHRKERHMDFIWNGFD